MIASALMAILLPEPEADDCAAALDEAAKEHACPLLYVGNDFPQTDIASAL
jgi:uncharacterized protein with PIN domain